MKKIILACLLLASINSAFAGDWITDHASNCKVWNSLPAPGETIIWTGKCVNGKVEGKGEVKWFVYGVFSSQHEGIYHEGKTDGQGIYIWPKGIRYEGGYRDSKRNGFGEMTTPKSAYVASERSKLGKWIGDQFVEKGIFKDNVFIRVCNSAADCKQTEHEEPGKRQRIEACAELYTGKAVAFRIWFSTKAIDTEVRGLITGIGREVASARIAESLYEEMVGKVVEAPCSDFR